MLPKESFASISWIGSIQAFLLIALGVIVGPLYDRRYLRGPVFTGSILVVVSTILTGICSTYWQVMLSQGILTGLGTGFLIFTKYCHTVPVF